MVQIINGFEMGLKQYIFLGQKFAQYELKIAVVKLIQTLRLELPSPDMEPILKAEIVLKPAEKLPIRFITRTTK